MNGLSANGRAGYRSPITKTSPRVVVQAIGDKGAAFAAWTLISLQDAPVDAANFYTAEIQMFGMFNLNGVPRKSFYAFKAFRALLDTPRRVQTAPCEVGRVAVCAGLNSDSTQASILLSNFNTAGAAPDLVVRALPWSVTTAFELYLLFNTIQSGSNSIADPSSSSFTMESICAGAGWLFWC